MALLTALDRIATGAYMDADPARYLDLPYNGRSVDDLLVMGGTLVAPGMEPYLADLSINYEWPLRREGARIEDVGDLREYEARDTLDASTLYVHLRAADEGVPYVGAGATPASFEVRRGADPDSELVWRIEGGVPFPVDETNGAVHQPDPAHTHEPEAP